MMSKNSFCFVLIYLMWYITFITVFIQLKNHSKFRCVVQSVYWLMKYIIHNFQYASFTYKHRCFWFFNFYYFFRLPYWLEEVWKQLFLFWEHNKNVLGWCKSNYISLHLKNINGLFIKYSSAVLYNQEKNQIIS